jgi:hypothetical protein
MWRTRPVEELLNFLEGVGGRDADAELRPEPERRDRAVLLVKLQRPNNTMNKELLLNGQSFRFWNKESWVRIPARI